MKSRIIMIFLLLTMFIQFHEPAITQDTSVLNKLGKKGRFLQEPVFNGSFFFYEGGTSNETTLILVHGIGDDASLIWKSVIPHLEREYHVITFDLPGFGASEKGSSHYSQQNYARFLKWVADNHSHETLYIAGHSMGGAIALYYAGTYNKDLDRLILVDVAGILHRAIFTKSRFKLGGKNSSRVIHKPLNAINRWLGNMVENVDRAMMPQNLEEYLQNSFFRENVVADKSAMNAGMSLISTNFAKQIFSVTAPTFIIWGEDDTIAPLRTGKILDSNIPRTKLYVMKNAKHNPMLEDPDAFKRRLIHCLTSPGPEVNPINSLQSKTKRVLNLEYRNDQQYSGVFKSVIIKNCQNITLKNIHAEKITVENSNIKIEYSTITSPETGINASNSVIEMTGVTINGEKSISSLYSKFDIAGVTLKGKKAAFESRGKTRVIFSVSRILSPKNNRYVHESKILYKDEFY
jgi:pimeloyl-ACP methyl ester carboxylesterase